MNLDNNLDIYTDDKVEVRVSCNILLILTLTIDITDVQTNNVDVQILDTDNDSDASEEGKGDPEVSGGDARFTIDTDDDIMILLKKKLSKQDERTGNYQHED